MKIALISDIHARGKDLDSLRRQLNASVPEMVKRGIDRVCVAGDVFDRPSVGDSQAGTGAIAEVLLGWVRELGNHHIDITMIDGNHDYTGAGGVSALRIFDGCPNVECFGDPGIRAIAKSGQSLAIAILPWLWSSELSPQAHLDEILNRGEEPTLSDLDMPKLLLGHVQVVGARMNGAFTCEATPGKWQISREYLEQYPVDRIALGDFHARQDLTGKGGYIGAFRQLNFGEEGNQAGFEVWDSETNEFEWVELDAAPKYRTVVVDDNDTSPVTQNANEKLRVRIEPDVAMSTDREAIKRLESEGVTVERIVMAEESVSRVEIPEGVTNDPHKLIDLWAGTQLGFDELRIKGMHVVLDEVFADKIVTPEPAEEPEPEAVPAQQATGTDCPY